MHIYNFIPPLGKSQISYSDCYILKWHASENHVNLFRSCLIVNTIIYIPKQASYVIPHNNSNSSHELISTKS